MLHLHHHTSVPPDIFSSSSSSINNKHKNPIFSSGLRKSSRKNISVNNGADKESGFEVDPDKAREALRKLDEELQSISDKKINPPKVRAVGMNESRPGEKEETLEISDSFLVYLASGLFLFTIFYNIFFITVIKPSVDGPGPDQSPTMFQEAQEQLSTGSDFPVGP